VGERVSNANPEVVIEMDIQTRTKSEYPSIRRKAVRGREVKKKREKREKKIFS